MYRNGWWIKLLVVLISFIIRILLCLFKMFSWMVLLIMRMMVINSSILIIVISFVVIFRNWYRCFSYFIFSLLIFILCCCCNFFSNNCVEVGVICFLFGVIRIIFGNGFDFRYLIVLFSLDSCWNFVNVLLVGIYIMWLILD